MTIETTEKAKRDRSITTRSGRRWDLVFMIGAIKPLTAVLGHPPREILTEPEKLFTLLIDPEKLAVVTYLFTPPVAPAIPKVSAEEFAADLDSDALDQAAEVVIRLVCDMYAPRGKKEEVAQAIIDSLREAGAKALEKQASGEQEATTEATVDATAA